MTNLLTGILLVSIIGLSLSIIIREKHKGSVCVGCPYYKSKDGDCTCKIVAFKEDIDPQSSPLVGDL